MRRIFGRHVYQSLLIPPHRNMYLDLFALFLPQPGLDDLILFDFVRKQNFLWNVVGILIILLDELLHDVFLAALFRAFYQKMVLADQLPPRIKNICTHAPLSPVLSSTTAITSWSISSVVMTF